VQLSLNFSLDEFLRSQTAARRGRVIVADEAAIANLRRLANEVLQPLRYALRVPIVITSGLRPPWLNAAIGGSERSAHLIGCAADVEVPGFPPMDVCQLVASLYLPVDQCIHEFPPNGWTHLSVPIVGTTARRQYLTSRFIAGSIEYKQGFLPA
jgi:zinc D-Ala-D-Ala carboxypeptidase